MFVVWDRLKWHLQIFFSVRAGLTSPEPPL